MTAQAATITIREVGPYRITYNPAEGYYRANGERALLNYLREALVAGPRINIAVVDTGQRGANGKPDMVALTADEIETARAAHRIYEAAKQADYAKNHAAEIARESERSRKAAAYRAGMLEGGEGYNPYEDAVADADHGLRSDLLDH